MANNVIWDDEPTPNVQWDDEPKTTEDQVDVLGKDDKQAVGAPLSYWMFGSNDAPIAQMLGMNDKPVQGAPGQPSYMPSSAEGEARNYDVARSIRQVPRDVAEAAIAMPSEMDRVEKEGIGYAKQFTDPNSWPGSIVRGYESLSNAADLGIGKYLPTQEDVQKYDSAVLGKPYESQTATGKILRGTLGALAPLGVSKALNVLKEGVATTKSLKTAEELNDTVVQPAFRAAHDAGETVKPNQIKTLASDLRQVAKENYVDDNTFPRVNAIIKDIESKAPQDVPAWQQKMHGAWGTDMPPKAQDLPHMELEKYRSKLRQMGREAGSADERRVANETADAIDESLDAQMASSPHLKEARMAFRSMKQSEALENLTSDAALTERARNGDYAGALVSALATKLKSGPAAKRWMRQFTPDQRAKLEGIIKDGGKSPSKIWNLLSQDKGFAVTILGYMSGGEAGAIGAQAVKAGANYMKGRPNAQMAKRFEEVQRFVQGLATQGKRKGSGLPNLLPAIGANAAAVGMSPSSPPAINPLNLLPQDRENLTPDAYPLGIRG